jgi:hypothetical protein
MWFSHRTDPKPIGGASEEDRDHRGEVIDKSTLRRVAPLTATNRDVEDDDVGSRDPTPGQPTPGHPTPGHPTPGHPTPGHHSTTHQATSRRGADFMSTCSPCRWSIGTRPDPLWPWTTYHTRACAPYHKPIPCPHFTIEFHFPSCRSGPVCFAKPTHSPTPHLLHSSHPRSPSSIVAPQHTTIPRAPLTQCFSPCC